MATGRKRIILVDDSSFNLVTGHNILKGTYDVFAIPSGVQLLKILETATIDLILLDIEMPDMSGYEVIRRLKANERTANIPVIFLTGRSDPDSEIKGLSLGAVDYIAKPFSPDLLLKRIELHLLIRAQQAELRNYNENLEQMVEEKTRTVLGLQNAILKTVAELIESRDHMTGGHIERTQSYLKVLVSALLEGSEYADEIRTWDVDVFIMSAQLHDVGKISICDNILQKKGPLNDEEYMEMKRHAEYGVNIIQRIERRTVEGAFLKHAEVLAGSHHERWDGTGYPHGLKGRDIPLQGRLMAIADVYDALISVRSYKKAIKHSDAVDIIRRERGTHFDPHLVDVFLAHEKEFEEIASRMISD